MRSSASTVVVEAGRPCRRTIGTVATVTERPVVIPCVELGPAIDALVDLLGFRLDMIMPADDPAIAELSGHGVRTAARCRRLNGRRRRRRPRRDGVPRPAAGAARGVASSPRTSRSPTAGRSPTTCTTTTSATSRSTACAGGCASVYEDQGPPFVACRRATACCSRRASATGCWRARPASRSSRSGLPRRTRRTSTTTCGCRPPTLRPERDVRRAALRPPPRVEADVAAVARRRLRVRRHRHRRGDGRARRRADRARRPAAVHATLVSHDGELLFWYVVDGQATLAARRPRRRASLARAWPSPSRPACLTASSTPSGLELLEVTLPGSLPGSG